MKTAILGFGVVGSGAFEVLEKAGYEVKNGDFFKIGIPFTLAAIIPAYIYVWLLFGVW